MASLSVHLAPENVLTLDAPDRESLLRELAQHGAERAGLDPELLHGAILERERLCSTALGQGVAMPHVRLPGVKRFTVLLARSTRGLDFSAPDAEPVRLFLLIVGPVEEKDGYVKLMGRAARFLRAESARLIEAEDLAGAVASATAEH